MANFSLEDVSYRYKNGDRDVLNSISCVFESGRLFAITGPSGSGKSTLLSIIAGFDAPSKGSVLIDGEDLADIDLDSYRREKVSMIFQAFRLFPFLTVLENVCYPMRLNGADKREAKARAAQYLESVGIDKDKHRRFPSNLSGGEQQRVAIARSLATGAKTLLADEPTGNLDGANTQNIMNILKRLACEDGYCVVVVTHDPEVSAVADIVYKINDGVLM